MEFIEAPAFTRYLSDYLDDEEYRALQKQLGLSPDVGDVIPGTGGFRKIRWADKGRGKGRRGGLRVIYYHFAADDQIWLMTLYGKDEAADLTPGGNVDGKEEGFRRANGRHRGDEEPPRRQTDFTQLQGGDRAASESGLEADSRHTQETALLACGLRAEVADQ
jgi:hypothetical protein